MATADIAVHPSADSLAPSLRSVLARLAPVRFVDRPEPVALRESEIVLSLSGQPAALAALTASRARCFHLTHPRQGARSEKPGEPIRFDDHVDLDRLLRGRSIPHWALTDLPAVPAEPGDAILAACGEKPVWIRRRVGGPALDLVSVPLPNPAPGEQIFDYLNGYHFIQLLPLLHFLREATSGEGWTHPPLRACFTFDDPNLHWPSYGFLPYREVIRLARRDRFHLSFATVPLDAWAMHPGAVRLFRENPAQLSLLIHGNNHTREELGRPRTADGHLRLLGQSLRRIARLEHATGLHIDRVSVPPHEAMAEGVPAAMLRLGFEGVSVTPWSLRHYYRGRNWPATFGLLPSESMDDGLPVLARDRLAADCAGPAVIAAFLGKPIVLIEHHQALAQGLELLTHAAQIVNSLGDVEWRSPQAILRANYLSRREGQTLWVQPFSCRISLTVPPGITALALAFPHPAAPEAPAHAEPSATFDLKQPAGGTAVRLAPGVPANVTAGADIELVSVRLGTVDYRRLPSPGWSVAALGRRILCEVRDRVAPLKAKARRANRARLESAKPG